MIIPWDRTPPQPLPGIVAVASADFSCAAAGGAGACFPGVQCIVPSAVDATLGARPRCGACPPGFSGDGITCRDVNECAAAQPPCHPEAPCINSPGGFTCGACAAPLRGNGTGPAGCAPPTESCAVSNGGCDPNSLCTDSPSGPVCGACNPGFSGSGNTSCVDIDGCKASPPQPNSTTPCAPRVACTDVPAALDPTGRLFTCGKWCAGWVFCRILVNTSRLFTAPSSDGVPHSRGDALQCCRIVTRKQTLHSSLTAPSTPHAAPSVAPATAPYAPPARSSPPSSAPAPAPSPTATPRPQRAPPTSSSSAQPPPRSPARASPARARGPPRSHSGGPSGASASRSPTPARCAARRRAAARCPALTLPGIPE